MMLTSDRKSLMAAAGQRNSFTKGIRKWSSCPLTVGASPRHPMFQSMSSHTDQLLLAFHSRYDDSSFQLGCLVVNSWSWPSSTPCMFSIPFFPSAFGLSGGQNTFLFRYARFAAPIRLHKRRPLPRPRRLFRTSDQIRKSSLFNNSMSAFARF